MQEAPLSANFVMFNPDGVRVQVTVRYDDETGVHVEHITKHVEAVDLYLEKLKRDGWRVNEGRPRQADFQPEVDFGSNPGGTAKVTQAATDHRKPGQVAEKQLNIIHALGNALYGSQAAWDEKRPALVQHFSKKRVTSSKELWVAEAVDMTLKLEERVREEYEKVAEGYPNPFELKNIDNLGGVELAKALSTLRALVAGSKAAVA